MQVAAWRRFGVGIAVICVHAFLFALLRPELQEHAMSLPPREIMVALLPVPQAAPEKIKTPAATANKVVSHAVIQPTPKPMPVMAPVPKPTPTPTPTTSVMPSHSVPPSPSAVASPSSAQPVQPVQVAQAAPALTPTAPTPAASPAQPKTVSSGVEYLQKPAPIYPSFSRRMQEEGKVMLRVLVNLKGKPEQVEIQKSSGFPRLDEAARQTVLSSYLFKPYSENGQAQSVFVLIPINFQLDN